MDEKPENTGNNQGRNPDGTFKDGQSGNPAGKPKGVKGFKTIFEEAVKKIAITQNTKKCDVEIDLVIKAIAEARKGNYNYYRDLFDRVYGKAQDNLDITSQGKEIEVVQFEVIKSKNGKEIQEDIKVENIGDISQEPESTEQSENKNNIE